MIAIKADKTRGPSPEVDKLLVELGNSGKGIPFYAVYPPDGSDPIVFDGIITQQKVIDVLAKVGPSKSSEGATSTVMKNRTKRR